MGILILGVRTMFPTILYCYDVKTLTVVSWYCEHFFQKMSRPLQYYYWNYYCKMKKTTNITTYLKQNDTRRIKNFLKRTTFFSYFLSDIYTIFWDGKILFFTLNFFGVNCFSVATLDKWNHCCQWKQIFNIWE